MNLKPLKPAESDEKTSSENLNNEISTTTASTISQTDITSSKSHKIVTTEAPLSETAKKISSL